LPECRQAVCSLTVCPPYKGSKDSHIENCTKTYGRKNFDTPESPCSVDFHRLPAYPMNPASMPPSLPLHLTLPDSSRPCTNFFPVRTIITRCMDAKPQLAKRGLFHVPFTSSLSCVCIIAFSVEYHWSLSSIHRLYLYIHHTILNYSNLKCSLGRCGILQVMWYSMNNGLR
jgi:hypothetical protein